MKNEGNKDDDGSKSVCFYDLVEHWDRFEGGGRGIPGYLIYCSGKSSACLSHH